MNKLLLLAVLFRAAQFYAHSAHQLVTGNSFFSDHEHLGDLYATYEDSYDSLIERVIGLGDKPNLVETTKNATKVFTDTFPEKGGVESYFKGLLAFESKIRDKIKDINDEQSLGTQNLIQDMADKSEQRTYKLKQRIG